MPVTEAREIVGRISLDGTLGLCVFGGILPGLLSGAIYMLVRPWLPRARAGGVVFGALHLVVAATRVDPLRPENPDFAILGPGWLAVVAFGAAAVVHGMAVVALANRYSAGVPPARIGRVPLARTVLPLAPPVLFLVPGAFLLVPIGLGLLLAVAASRVDGGGAVTGKRTVVVAGRVAVAVLTLALLPGTVRALADIIARD
jgi:hypothetical protein